MTEPRFKLNDRVRVVTADGVDPVGHVVGCVSRFGVCQVWFGDRDYQWVAESRLLPAEPGYARYRSWAAWWRGTAGVIALEAGGSAAGRSLFALLDAADAAVAEARAEARDQIVALFRTGRFCSLASHMQQACDCDEFAAAVARLLPAEPRPPAPVPLEEV